MCVCIAATGEEVPTRVHCSSSALLGYSIYAPIHDHEVRSQMTSSEERENLDDSPREAPESALSSAETDEYDLAVIGGGAAGLTASAVATNLGAKTLLVEADRLGGDCTWTGCVPSKALLKSAEVAHAARNAEQYGIDIDSDSIQVDFGQVMRRVRSIRTKIYEEEDHPENFEEMGIEVTHGVACFLDDRTLEIRTETGSQTVTANKFVVGTGGRPLIPPIAGLDEISYHTSETIFELEERPERLGIIGGGPIGTEMSQAFRRLGSEVVVFEALDRILHRDDPELTEMLQEKLAAEGVEYRCGARVERVDERGNGRIVVRAEGDETHEETVDALLVAVGRRPNLTELDLEAAGVEYSERGITVDDRCRTSRPHIYASGDVTGRYQFTHMSEHMSKVAVTNALLKWPMTIDVDHVPRVTYTDPELAHVGATRAELEERGTAHDVYRFPYEKVDRAVTDGETTGMIKIFARSWNGKILGASVLGARAGELISEYALAMRNGVTLRNVADTIHPYPSYGLAVRRGADQWYARKQSPTFTRILQTVFGYRGPVIEPDPDRIV